MKLIKKVKHLWSLAHRDEAVIEELANMIADQERISLQNGIPPLSRKTWSGNGKAEFIPLMSETERDEYLKNQEPWQKKLNEKLKELLK